MATNRFCIESFLDSMELKYFTQNDDEPAWVVMFSPGIGVFLTLNEDGEYLRFRSLPLINRRMLTPGKNNLLNAALLKLNGNFKIGHFGGDDDIVVEMALPIEDSELTAGQFQRCMAIVCSEAIGFMKRLPGLIGDEEPAKEEDMIGELIHRLIGDQPTED